MSRIILSRNNDREERFVVGYDHKCLGAFWQEFASEQEIADAEDRIEKAEDQIEQVDAMTYKIAERGIRRSGGMWPGIPLDDFRESVPEDLRLLITDEVMVLLREHAEDPDSGYNKRPIDLSHG